MKTITEQSLESGVTTVRLVGDLTKAGLPACRNSIAKAAAQCPVAVVVDLSELHHADPLFGSMVATATFKAQENWGVPLLLCTANSEIRGHLAKFRSFVALYEQRSQALLAVHAYVPRWIKKRFPPVPASAGEARSIVGDACWSWGLRHLRDPAQLVASELASNAIVHAGTDFDLMLGYTGRFLRIAVSDGSGAMPSVIKEPPVTNAIMPGGTGRGMRIIAAAGTHYGVTRTRSGKVVWVLIVAHDR
ncbi:anti-anti-sigma regulatory factor [Actinoplanes octamycinicus]|uniref:Anti-anti-sigma regulatory factor n=1 Tax=Actinoplanes octamycinicus TaxID=135948 RepID=A0A7W7MAE6_9ACTN|nr:hypothetical protein [Actinoplanes octamycinicus]MBB4742907.1 anti-anti-sigma regulatory factor [Actinoplanes octamycinicus]GIE58240.1 hypothetical protein Aoc01nite_36420 [Actinoplanes octamycinicus]